MKPDINRSKILRGKSSPRSRKFWEESLVLGLENFERKVSSSVSKILRGKSRPSPRPRSNDHVFLDLDISLENLGAKVSVSILVWKNLREKSHPSSQSWGYDHSGLVLGLGLEKLVLADLWSLVTLAKSICFRFSRSYSLSPFLIYLKFLLASAKIIPIQCALGIIVEYINFKN